MALITESFESITYETHKAIERAELNGFTVIRPLKNQLLIDLDRPYDPCEFDRRMQWLRETNPDLRPAVVDAWDSKDGGRHVVSLATTLTPPERLGLEVMLGSDPIRGMHGFRKYREQSEEPESMLFRPPAPQASSALIDLGDDDIPF